MTRGRGKQCDRPISGAAAKITARMISKGVQAWHGLSIEPIQAALLAEVLNTYNETTKKLEEIIDLASDDRPNDFQLSLVADARSPGARG